MHKQTPKLEWRFSESDAEWAAQQALLLPAITAADSRRLRLKQYVGIVMTTLLFFYQRRWLVAPACLGV